MRTEAYSTADKIDAQLPQLQCQRCGYPSCRQFAEAVSDGDAPGNRCDPGGIRVLNLLNSIIDQTHQGLDPNFDSPLLPTGVVIRESECIGCTLCIQACPVAAIIGAGKLMHTVISTDCTACELCLPVCPVNCISPINFQKKDTSTFQRSLTTQSSHHRLNFERWQRRTEPTPIERTYCNEASLREEIARSVARVRVKRSALNQEHPPSERGAAQ